MRSTGDGARWLAGLALAAVLGGCVDRPGLVDPDATSKVAPADAPRLTFGTGVDSVVLYEGFRIGITPQNDAAKKLAAQVLLLDQSRQVLWRSDPKRVADGDSIAWFTISNLPASLPRGSKLFITGSMEDTNGSRYYATDDSAAQMSLTKAAVRPAYVFDGQVLQVGQGTLQAMVAAPDQGVVFFANSAVGSIGTVSLATGAVDTLAVRVGSAPSALDYRAGTLAALVASGVEVSVMKVTGGHATELYRPTLPPFYLHILQVESVDTAGKPKYKVLDAGVRPYARSIALGCVGGTGCQVPQAYGASGLSDGGNGIVRALELGQSPPPPMVMLGFLGSGGDTLPAQVSVIGGTPPSGSANVLMQALSVDKCLTLQLGAGPIAASPVANGPLYAASPSGTLCGDGTRVVRVDNAQTDSAQMSMWAYRNMLAEDRIGPVTQMKISADGTKLLLLGQDVVYILDDWLRMRGRVAVPGARSISWLQEANAPSSDRFAVADGTGVTVYESERLTSVGRFAIGGTQPFLMEFARAAGSTDYVVVAVAEGGKAVIVARKPQF